ncbi:glutamine amidotransferase subunit DUG2 KNAG_0C01680 [Huiozyma naganishii CBS 8797]|uniref:Peptidase M20 dimerisation domain-containing protein n=1 Tax=Huiozyma naganishii (strain ATCC MYA-139 / BCRC 22969 / CBS 8797 / KCTC 17520 / NBRC 10181 / NCYC 3082 / Yp74L-3) TaxID=1071383 RepID=J7RWA8_HUIN7|nr:hypothetical protein KNAG_0C01680 [Kazachstania naganishii CBS 8797]CCK69282.1 hypothetical protein KNAG_0C01680 [Kazachstania naganishii CBS 8797]
MLGRPELMHRWNHSHSILSICVFPHKKLLFAGTQDSKILVLDKATYNIVETLHLGESQDQANTRSSVLCMDRSADERYLFSAGADSLVRVWFVDHCKANGSVVIKELATVYSVTDIGDIFALRYLEATQTLVFGCQNASLLFINNIIEKVSGNRPMDPQTNLDKLPHRRYDKFFDSLGPSESATPNPSTSDLTKNSREASPPCNASTRVASTILEVPAENIVRYAHNGFIYSICKLPHEINICNTDGALRDSEDRSVQESIISGSGDGVSKIWRFTKSDNGEVTIKLVAEEMDNDDVVFSQTVEFPFLYCGLGDGAINIWDLNTRQLVSHLQTPTKSDVTSLTVYEDYVFAVIEEGITIFYGDQISHWDPYQGKLLSSEVFESCSQTDNGGYPGLVAGGNDGSLTLWDLKDLFETAPSTTNRMDFQRRSSWVTYKPPKIDTEEMLSTLKRLIAFQTVSQGSDTAYQMASRKCATFLLGLFKHFGAVDSQLLPAPNNCKSVVTAIQGKNPNNKRIVWYGHYDVIAPGDTDRWNTEPFNLTCENGYLKGRGVTDNKGPLVSALYSVTTLLQQDNLLNDVVFLVEGSEEIGSPGFESVCHKYKHLIGDNIDWILLSNSSWVDREHPCLNYGLRGVVNAQLKIYSDQSNGHSGVNGGVYWEPTFDLLKVVSNLRDAEGRIKIPGFYDSLTPTSEEDSERFKNILEVTELVNNSTLENVIDNWTRPSLSVTAMGVSGSGNVTVIPKVAWMGVSIRIVPGQNLKTVKESFIKYVNDCFEEIGSPNHLRVTIMNEAEAWLGDPTNHAYQVAREEIYNAWQVEPLFVREGGSIPSVRILERVLDAPAVQIPCGQSTDNAHLDNENLRIKNWTNLADILANVFNRL